MNIGFYGQSDASWAGYKISGQLSFIDQIIIKKRARLANIGTPQGSEERILFELKKTKDLDLAIIFHSLPKFIYLPSCNRDLTLKELESRAVYLWREIGEHSTEAAKAKDHFFSNGGIKETFGDIETFLKTIGLYKEFLHHPDLAMNRFTGALIQIDQYITSKQIPCIHIPIQKVIPPWFSFSSGKILPEVQDLTLKHREVGTYTNNISAEGQDIIAERLLHEIDALSFKK